MTDEQSDTIPSLHHQPTPTAAHLRDQLVAAEAAEERERAAARERRLVEEKKAEAAARNDGEYLPKLDAINAQVRAPFPEWETLAAEVSGSRPSTWPLPRPSAGCRRAARRFSGFMCTPSGG